MKAAGVGAGAEGVVTAGAGEGGSVVASDPAFLTTGCALAALEAVEAGFWGGPPGAEEAGVCGGPPGRMALQKDDVSVLGRRTGIGGGGCLLGSPGFTKLSIISSWRWNSYK